MNFSEALEICESFVFNKQKAEESKNIKLIANEAERIINKIKNEEFVLKGYSLKGRELRLNFTDIDRNSSIYSQSNLRSRSEVIQKIRNALRQRSISMKRINDYFVLNFDNRKPKYEF